MSGKLYKNISKLIRDSFIIYQHNDQKHILPTEQWEKMENLGPTKSIIRLYPNRTYNLLLEEEEETDGRNSQKKDKQIKEAAVKA